MCKEVCRGCCIDNIIAPYEADSQVGRRNNSEFTNSALVLCRDTDLLAYGNTNVVFIDSYFGENWRHVNMNTPVTNQIKKDFPLYAYYHKYGIKIIHWWAAVRGCDISVVRSGIANAGRETFMSAISSFDEKDASLLTPRSFAKALQKYGTLACTVRDIETELKRVSDYFLKKGTYYDQAGNIYSVDGKLIQRGNTATRRHMNGESNTKTGKELTAEEKRDVTSVQPHNLQHNSATDREKINGISLPENKQSLNDCKVEELKAMIICRGGSLTGKDGKSLTRPQLILQLKAYMKMEKEKPSSVVFFDRSRCNNGIFAKLDTSERRSLPQMLNDLVNTPGYEPNIHAFFEDLLRCCTEGKFVDDFATIALEAPEITAKFIVQELCHIGDKDKQKNITSGLKKMMEMDELLYHGVATANDGKSIYIVSKQRASMNHDEKTRNKTEYGEKPKFAEYLAMCHLAVQPTTHESHGHTLGVCTRVLQSFCAQCKAGVGLCHHQGSLLQAQLLHWGEGRPTEKPSTIDYCSWVPGSKQSARTCTTKLPASEQHIMQLPGTNKEAKEKLERGIKKNIHEGISATYDVYKPCPLQLIASSPVVVNLRGYHVCWCRIQLP